MTSVSWSLISAISAFMMHVLFSAIGQWWWRKSKPNINLTQTTRGVCGNARAVKPVWIQTSMYSCSSEPTQPTKSHWSQSDCTSTEPFWGLLTSLLEPVLIGTHLLFLDVCVLKYKYMWYISSTFYIFPVQTIFVKLIKSQHGVSPWNCDHASKITKKTNHCYFRWCWLLECVTKHL